MRDIAAVVALITYQRSSGVKHFNVRWGIHASNPDVSSSFWEGGGETVGNTYRRLGVCVAYMNGLQVGKAIPAAMVLESVDAGVGWKWAYGSGLPDASIEGGRENGQPQYICRAWYQNGYHPGKRLGDGCHIGWGNAERVEHGWFQVLAH